MTNNDHDALKISLFGALFLAILGIGFALATKSQAVLLDGVFNCISVFTAWFGLRIAKLIQEPLSERLPAGYVAFEPLYVLMKGLIVFGLSATVLISSIITLLSGGSAIKLGLVLVYISIASIANILMYALMKQKASKATSPMLETEKDNWFINMLVTLSIAFSFIIVILFKDGPLKPFTVYIDQIIVIIVVLLTISVPVRSIKEGLKELLLFGADKLMYQKIRELSTETLSDLPVENIKLLIFKIGRSFWITYYIKPIKSSIDVKYPDILRGKIQNDISKYFPVSNIDIIITEDVE